MITPTKQDAIHKAVMIRLLSNILDDRLIYKNIAFKGGSCAGMLGFLNRFSLDLDFDLLNQEAKSIIRKTLKKIFANLQMTLKEESKKELFFLLKYQAFESSHNTLKISIVDNPLKSNLYQPYFIEEIKKFVLCQTVETMFANKLVTVVDRYRKYKSLAGRDIYDIHHFFSRGFSYRKEVILERENLQPKDYLLKLYHFIEKEFSQKIIDQELNYLLPIDRFKAIRKTLKNETLVFIKDEIKRLE